MNKHGLTFLEFVIVMLVFGVVAYFITRITCVRQYREVPPT